MVFNNILRAINIMTGANELKIQELKDLRVEFRSKGYNELWEIPPGPKKERWIKLLKDLGIKVSDPVTKAKLVYEDNLKYIESQFRVKENKKKLIEDIDRELINDK